LDQCGPDSICIVSVRVVVGVFVVVGFVEVIVLVECPQGNFGGSVGDHNIWHSWEVEIKRLLLSFAAVMDVFFQF